LIGNKRDVPPKYPWIKFKEWSEVYGPIYTIWFGRRPTVIISDPHVAVALMEKRSQKYSSRPRFVVMGEVYWNMASILVQPYSKEWSVRRKLLHTALTPRALQNYFPVQEAEACRLCYFLLNKPDQWEQLLDWMTASIVFSIAYGHRIDSMDSWVIRQRMDIMHYNATLNVPGKFLAESFPVLKYIPDFLAPWKREVKRRGAIEAGANMRLAQFVKQEMEEAEKSGTSLPNSLCRQLHENRAKDPQAFALLSDRDFSFIPGSLFGAGADTTASTLCSAFLALVTHPETLEAAHAELDHVVGKQRMPTFEDEAQLPYIRALCKETLRWRPVAVLGGTPHATSEADTYEGYHIPKGTNILGNTWAINHNERYYPNSHHFNPLRFLDVDPATLLYLPKSYITSTPQEKGTPHPSKLGHSSFGWGRRICPGADLASNNLFIALASLLWTCDIMPKKGVVYDIWDYVGGFNIRPRHFQCEIRVRSEGHERVLGERYREAVGVMEGFPEFREEEVVV
jgi:cytochrome P450